MNKLITNALKKALGTESAPITAVIEKGGIRRFAEAIEDPNPLYQDELAARSSRYGGIVAPPTFLRSLPTSRPELPLDPPLERILDGGSAWEYLEPVRVGDVITAVTRIADLNERESKSIGQMLIATFETIYTNQFCHVVAKQRATTIHY